MFENTVNDVQGSVVETPNETDSNVSAEGIVALQNPDDGSSGEGKQPPEAVAKPRQSAEENSRYAEMRRESERHQREYDSLKNDADKLVAELKAYGFSGNNMQEIADHIKAQSLGIDYDEYVKSEQVQKQKIDEAVKNHPKVIAAEEYARQNQYAKDLATVKAAYPECKAESVMDIGDVFISAMAGGLSPEDAYAAQLAHDNRNKVAEPP